MKALPTEIGQRFGFLTVTCHPYTNDSGIRVVELVCDCGKTIKIARKSCGAQKSCGCMKGELIRASRIKHGMSVKNVLYNTWNNIKARCYNQKSTHYDRYGGRGIKMCDRWKNDFASFALDMGERPDGASIDRIDGNQGYSPENCRWATSSEQAYNRPGHQKWQPVFWMGVNYPSLTQASKATRISRRAIQKAISMNSTLVTGLPSPPDDPT